jgi:hypothetical protein
LAKQTDGIWREAQKYLEQAAQLSTQFGLDPFLLLKWQALMDFYEKPDDASARNRLEVLKKEALNARDSESARDFDYHVGILAKQKHLLQRVFYGTPFPSFRNRILSKAGGWLEFPKNYTWALKGRHGPLLDLGTGQTPWSSQRPAALLLKVLRILSSDFYRPSRLAAIFANLYPTEHFDPVTSPIRVRRALQRTRAWLGDSEDLLQLHCDKNLYSLRATLPLDIRVSREYESLPAAPAPQEAAFALKLQQAFPYKAFSTKQAAEHLEVSVSRAKLILETAHSHGAIKKIGHSRSTLYRFGK